MQRIGVQIPTNWVLLRAISYGSFHMLHFIWTISYVCHTRKDVSNEIIKLPSSDLDGIWHAYIGHHPDYDCIDCQQIRFLGQTFFRIFMNHII